MRYINKGNEPNIILNYRNLCQAAGQIVSYEDFPHLEQLNNLLRTKQKCICCYCMQRIDHYQQENEAGSHNEHLIPQRGVNGNPTLQMDYNNIFACCNYTKDYANEDSFCGWHKKHRLITNFIQQPDCRTFFKYNSAGEILPNGNYETEAEYTQHANELPLNQKNALDTIKVLNLNQAVLKKRRSDLIKEIFPILKSFSSQKAQAQIQRIINLNPLPPFVEVNIYYLSKVR